ncbi:MAG: hypothetical protein IJ125_06310 [Atopobiaceae bacterium]|nr:hypothetical protein [Atopobiaceae bacterium]
MPQRYVRGTEALQTNPRESYALPRQLPALDLIEGSATQTQVRPRIDTGRLVHVLRIVAICFAVVLVLGSISVASQAMASKSLKNCSTIRKDIQSSQALQDDLKMQISTLSSSERIVRIATDNMGMVAAASADPLVIIVSDQTNNQSEQNVEGEENQAEAELQGESQTQSDVQQAGEADAVDVASQG